MDKKSKIYIAGHTGMTGSAVLSRLKKEGYTNLILRTRKELNLLDQKAVADFFTEQKPEYVVVCAARVGGIRANMEFQAEFLFENLQIQNNILWNAHATQPRKLLFLGSSCIYPRNAPQPMKEEYMLDGKPEPTNDGYAIAKIAGVTLCRKIFEQYKQPFISCIPTNLYGPHDHFDESVGHVIPSLIKRIHEAKIHAYPSVEIWGTGESRREFLYIEDFSDAILWLLQHYEDASPINVGTGEDVSIRELAYLLCSVVGYQGELVFDATKPDGMPKKLLDVSLMHEKGWKHKYGLREGLEKTYSWYLSSLSKQ